LPRFYSSQDRLGEQLQAATQLYKFTTYLAYSLAVVLSKIRDGLKIRHQLSGEPHQLDITLRLTLQAATGLNPIEVAVDIDF
jgi:hypothetical protein